MDLDLIKLIDKYRANGSMNEAFNLSIGILKSYKLDINSETLDDFSDYIANKLLQIYYNLSIILFYINDKKTALKISEKLIYQKINNNLNVKNISENKRFLVSKLSDIIELKTIPVSFIPPDIPGTDKKFNTLNPSILQFNGDYFLIIRCVNYTNDRCINFTAIEGSYNNKIMTRNFLIKLDSNFNMIFTKELINKSDLVMKRDAVQGLEDVHLFKFNNTLHFVCSTYYTSSNGVDICHGYIENDKLNKNQDIIEINNIEIIEYSEKQLCEKNWLGFEKGNNICYLYSQEPLTILSNGNKKLVKQSHINCSQHRGSGGPLQFENGYLIISHEVVWNGNGRTYMHKFVYYDDDFNLIKISLPFKFESVNVDYCRSMTYSIDKNSIILGVGIEDKNFRIYSFSISEIDKLLYSPIPYLSKEINEEVSKEINEEVSKEINEEVSKEITEISIFNASHVTQEIEIVIYNFINKTFGDKYLVTRGENINYDAPSILYIIICPAGLKNNLRKPKNYIPYQLEPSIYKLDLVKENYLDFLKSGVCVWDYNEENIKYLNSLGIENVKYFPFCHEDSLTKTGLSEYNDVNKDIDVLFLGWTLPNTRRANMENILKTKGFNTVFIWDKNPEEMKELIVRSKICLNIHTYEKGFLETARLSNYLSNQSCVISENSEDSEIVDIYEKGGVIFSSYQEMANIVTTLLRDENKRKEVANNSFEWYKNERNIYKLMTNEIIPNF